MELDQITCKEEPHLMSINLDFLLLKFL